MSCVQDGHAQVTTVLSVTLRLLSVIAPRVRLAERDEGVTHVRVSLQTAGTEHRISDGVHVIDWQVVLGKHLGGTLEMVDGPCDSFHSAFLSLYSSAMHYL
jgi:hypothetical protein